MNAAHRGVGRVRGWEGHGHGHGHVEGEGRGFVASRHGGSSSSSSSSSSGKGESENESENERAAAAAAAAVAVMEGAGEVEAAAEVGATTTTTTTTADDVEPSTTTTRRMPRRGRSVVAAAAAAAAVAREEERALAATTTTTTTTKLGTFRSVSPSSASTVSSSAVAHLAESFAMMTDMRVDATENGTEMRWCLFAKDVRGSVGKIIVDTRDGLGTAAKVVSVFVRPEFRGRKLGEMLVRRAQRALYENGFDALELDAEEKVELHGKLVGLYEKLGFAVCEEYRVTYEYNDDEAFRKVHMRCDLRELFEGARRVASSMSAPSSSASVAPATSSSSSSSAKATNQSTNGTRSPLLDSYEFTSRMRREALELVAMMPLRLDVASALSKIEAVHPELRESSLRTGMWIRRGGHPDWLELAGYLRHLGRAQE